MSDVRNAIQKLEKLRQLPPGWNYGRGAPLTAKTFAFSLITLNYLQSIGADRFDVLPSDDGGATILASYDGDVAEVVIKKGGVFDLFLDANDCVEFEDMDFGKLIKALEDAGWRSPKSSGSQTHVFSVASTEDSLVKPSPIMALVHRWSRQSALKQRVAACAPISTDTTGGSVAPRQFFGVSQQKPLLTAHG